MSSICVDLGASGTRIVGSDAVEYELSNEVVFEDRTAVVDLEVMTTGVRHEDFATAVDIVIEKVSGDACKAFPCRAIGGPLANRYAATTTRPSVMMNKSKQPINLTNLLIAAAHQMYVNGVKEDKMHVYVALPPLEVTHDTKEAMTSQLVGSYKINLVKLDAELSLTIETVSCFPESYMALAAFFFNFPDCSFNKANVDKYGKGYVMSLDIGASTTDASIALDMKLQEKSGQTFKTGGNIIEAHLANNIRAQYGYDPRHEDLLQAVCEGRLARGNSYVDVSDALRRAKREFSRSITNSLTDYFRLVNIPLQSIKAIVVNGGGSLESGYVDESGKTITTCPSVAKFITDEFANIVDTVDIITMKDARRANLHGLYVRMKMDQATAAAAAAKKAKEQAAAAQAAAEVAAQVVANITNTPNV